MISAEEREISAQALEELQGLNGCLKEYGYTDREREQILVRLLLCFFSQDTGVFGEHSFTEYLYQHPERTPAERLNRLFRILGGRRGEDPEETRFPVLSSTLFDEETADRGIDDLFLAAVTGAARLPWRKLSPAIFGAVFQAVMNQHDRREWGAYYTSEEVIDWLIDPLFMEELLAEREACRGKRKKLAAFQDKLSRLTFLDPACGCGNFLIRIYERLRELEFSVIGELYDTSQRVLDISLYCHISSAQFLGIEVEPLQAQIARISLWLAERRMDLAAAEQFGMGRISPVMISPLSVRTGNALTLDWREFVSRERLSYIVGNPPFVGARLMTPEQKLDVKTVFRGAKAPGNMDYVTAWYRKAAEFISGTQIRAAFVSTNSITQGEQASLLWRDLKERFGMRIDYARKSFIWNSGVQGQARVHCVIVGFSDASTSLQGGQIRTGCRLYDEHGCRLVPQINAYLLPAEDVWIRRRMKPAAGVPEMVFGNMANDGGSLILSPEERAELLSARPELKPVIRPFLGSEEFISGRERWCLWLADADLSVYGQIPEVRERIRRVQAFRERSSRRNTRLLAAFPERFGEIRQPESGYMILVPRVSSCRRPYIPIGFVPADWIVSDAVLVVPGADEALFALLTSRLHMTWVRSIAGRLKSDFRYSASVVYNNYPFPETGEEQREQLRQAGEKILRIREQYRGASLAELYDPERMPGELRQAHRELDELAEAVSGCGSTDEEEQLAFLFRKYRELTEKQPQGSGS